MAEHRRCLARHQVLLHPDHARTLRLMRAETTVSGAFAAAVADVEQRDLAVYDRAVGLG